MLLSILVKVSLGLGALLNPSTLRSIRTRNDSPLKEIQLWEPKRQTRVETSIRLEGGDEPYHGYVLSPPSRAYLCLTEENDDCGGVKYEPQSVECQKNFPINGPKDGRIASCEIARFEKLDEYGPRRWRQTNLVDYFRTKREDNGAVKYILDIDWLYTVTHATQKYELFASTLEYNPYTMPLSRRYLVRVGTFYTKETVGRVSFTFNRLNNFHERGGVLLAVWSIGDTNNAFYQVIDYKMNFGNDGKNYTNTKLIRAAVKRTVVVTESRSYNICPRLDRGRCVKRQYVINPCNCHQFYYCSAITQIVTMSCPAGLVYDESLGVCNWRQSVILPPDVTCD